MGIGRERIVEEAVSRTGLDTFGDSSFLEGLDRLVESINADRDLPQQARTAAAQRLTGLLEQRLCLYADRRTYPEIAAQRIERPLIVIGMPRSGTTFLHALLAQDPASRSPLAWQLGQVSPPPRQETFESDPRIAATDAAQAGLPEDFRIMHLVGAKLPDECNAILNLGFFSPNFDASWNVRSYLDWFVHADAQPYYALHRHMLQHLQAFTTGERWVLKAPPHMFHIAALIHAYPDAA
uniref:sulfotransferase family protein n=1 Tax=Sphingobium sp. Sx8-8 TaxID=2933617 RepID=UPI001F55D115